MARIHALACLAVRHEAGLIRSAARPPYGELPGYARTRVYRRAATSGPPNKTLDLLCHEPASPSGSKLAPPPVSSPLEDKTNTKEKDNENE